MAEDVAQMLVEDLVAARYEQDASHTLIGANVAWFSGSRANNIVLFVNQIKGARPWDDPFDLDTIQYDENGYPTNLPGDYVVSQLLIRSADMAGIAPHDGRFRLYGRGAGRFTLISSARGREVGPAATRALPKERVQEQDYWYVDLDFVIDPRAPISQIKMQIDQLVTGDHIRDLALVHHSHLDAFRAGAVFAPELEQDLEIYGALRLMDWMRANRIEEEGDGWREAGSDWSSPNPEQRYIAPEFYTFNNHAGGRRNEGRFEISVPIEHVVELANRTGADPWINLPVDVTDDRAIQLADYVSEHLNPELTPRWEYGNELFNSAIGFEGYRYAIRMSRLAFDQSMPDSPDTAVEWAAYRGPQLYQIIKARMAASDRPARFVAPGWAFSGSLSYDGGLNRGFLVRYFRAERSQSLGDGTKLPLQLVTDYAVAMYFGETLSDRRPDAPVVSYILETVDGGAQAQAEKIADWLLFGSDPDRLVMVDLDALDRPVRDVPGDGTIDIGVTGLISADVDAGIDPLRDLEKVLRIEGRALQYRGVNSPIWQDVLVFDEPPSMDLPEMIAATRIVGHGGRLGGQTYAGLRSGLGWSAGWRLDAHGDYARALGLNFVAYEGGSHVSDPPEGALDAFAAFNTGPAGARVLERWLQIMSDKGLEEYMHFMSHNRTNAGDWWGVQDYVGQPIEERPEAQVLRRAIAAYEPRADRTYTGPLQGASDVGFTPTGELVNALRVRWRDGGPWVIDAQGNATESLGDTQQLRLASPLPVNRSTVYRFSANVALADTNATELRFVARAVGEPATQLVRWEGEVRDGQTLEFELGGFLEGHSGLILSVQRVGADRAGRVVLSDAQVSTVDR